MPDCVYSTIFTIIVTANPPAAKMDAITATKGRPAIECRGMQSFVTRKGARRTKNKIAVGVMCTPCAAMKRNFEAVWHRIEARRLEYEQSMKEMLPDDRP